VRYTVEYAPEPAPTPKECEGTLNRTIIADLSWALVNGDVVGFKKDVQGDGYRDLVYTITIRHKSTT
jgi:hypothetical protein